MQPIRLIYQNAPSMINIPKQFNGHAIEVIIWPLDKSEVKQSVETDANGWPIGFFERTFGSIPDLPERESQGDYETRLEL